MAEIRAEGPLGDLAERGGPLISRFSAMRGELPPCDDPLLHSAREVLDMVFANHAMALHAALDLLAVSWRSERMRAELHRLEGLGRPATRLRTIPGELAEELEAPAWTPGGGLPPPPGPQPEQHGRRRARSHT